MIVILFGLIAGIITGLGMGGGTILILLLSVFLGQDQHVAQATNLIFFIPTSIAAIYTNLKYKNVNLKLESGKIYGLVGRNGSGKSVLLKIMTGLMEPSDGIIKYGGIPLKKGQYAKDVGIVLDCIGFMPEYTAKENLLLLAKINKETGEERINEILKQVGLEPDSKKVYRKFSLGMKQKLAIAQAFMEEPKVLLLDEPMNALDEQSVQDMRIMFREYVNKKPAIMVITSHHKEDIEILCDQVYSIKNGYVNL